MGICSSNKGLIQPITLDPQLVESTSDKFNSVNINMARSIRAHLKGKSRNSSILIRQLDRNKEKILRNEWWKDKNKYNTIENMDINEKLDWNNEDDWLKYLERQYHAQDALQERYKKAKKYELDTLIDKDRGYIRPFISSTFRDFADERDCMQTSAFPRIEKECNTKGLTFTPLDLRWGVTSEQSSSGQVVKICLDEVDNCRPYFIGCLGFRKWLVFTTKL